LSDAVKVAKIQENAELRRQLLQLAAHPVYSLIIGFVVIEVLQNTRVNGRQVMPEAAGNALEIALAAPALFQAVANTGIVQSLAPLLLRK